MPSSTRGKGGERLGSETARRRPSSGYVPLSLRFSFPLSLIISFSSKTITFPPALTTILIDPPRKGCDDLFLSQLLAFNPATIIYVSCNVHTQARDIGWIVRESEKKVKEEGKGKKGFWIESVRAADLFANTHHAEGVAVLRREL
jgi:hypothetical protein